MRSDPSKPGWGLRGATWAAVLFLHIPLALIILYAFSAEDKSYVFPPPALTTQWFAVAWEREDVWAAIGLSMRVALIAQDGFSKLLAAGLSFGFALQTFIIVGGVLRLVPLTGITLPFVSYGGTSIVANFAMVALLLLVSNRAVVTAR